MTIQQKIAGVDEAGRGPLAGPVVAAAVILAPNCTIAGLADSKKLSPKNRTKLYDEICAQAMCWHVAAASVVEIDKINILQASLLAMRRAVMGLTVQPELVQVDGNQTPELPYRVEAIVKGDESVAAISAASIIAKVTRDNIMIELDHKYPEYGFAQHKGYPTKQHRTAVAMHGRSIIHRKSFNC